SVVPDSGAIGTYEGVQARDWGDSEYWHPDPVDDKYKDLYGFPNNPGLLSRAIGQFHATGVGIPWWQTYGNHDGLMQGNKPRDDSLNGVAVGPAKPTGAPPGANPCDA